VTSNNWKVDLSHKADSTEAEKISITEQRNHSCEPHGGYSDSDIESSWEQKHSRVFDWCILGKNV